MIPASALHHRRVWGEFPLPHSLVPGRSVFAEAAQEGGR